MQDLRYDTLILSDLHLGSEISRAAEALQLLRNSSFQRLILLGDIFCDLDFSRLKKEHWNFLSYIRKLSNPKRKTGSRVGGRKPRPLADLLSRGRAVPNPPRPNLCKPADLRAFICYDASLL